jgi:hypothetical protein
VAWVEATPVGEAFDVMTHLEPEDDPGFTLADRVLSD